MSCYLFIHIVKLEASQSITEITAENLSSLVTSDQLSVDNPNTLHTVGECVTAIRYTNCLLQPESFTWYLNGSKINGTNFVDESGKLTFTNAQDIHAGLYFCVITLPGQLGSYITTARQLKLSSTETPPGNACNHLLHQHIHVLLCRSGQF